MTIADFFTLIKNPHLGLRDRLFATIARTPAPSAKKVPALPSPKNRSE
ncbi:hypothetical protein [Oligoflexus tunisiensis]|nr:hypothetical protein [Oligoflexus tunisiensis]